MKPSKTETIGVVLLKGTAQEIDRLRLEMGNAGEEIPTRSTIARNAITIGLGVRPKLKEMIKEDKMGK